MELTGLKNAINTGVLKEGNSLNNTESNSRTLGYKQIKNSSLPKFQDGFISPFQMMTQNGLGSVKNEVDAISLGTTLGSTVGGVTDPYSINPMLNATPLKNIPVGQTSKSSGAGVSGIGNVVTSGIQFAGDAIGAFSVNETGDEIAKRQGTSNMSIGGILYQSQNMIDVGNEMDRVKKENLANTLKTVGSGAALGAAAGSIIPGLGTVAGGIIGAGVGLLTGIFGGESRRKKYIEMLAKQNAKINALLDSSRFSALTKAILLQNAREYGNNEQQYLYGAADGKQPQVDPNTGMSKNNFLLATPYGYKIGKADSLVEPGETLFDTKTGSMALVPRQIGGKLHPGDILPAEVGNAAVFTDRHNDPITGKSFAQAAIDGDDDPYNLLYRQKVLVNDRKNNKGLMKAKNGRLPKFNDGFISPWKMMLENVKKSSQNNINRWKNTIALPELLGFGGYVDPYSINPNLNPPSSKYNDYTNEGGTGKWFTSPLDNLPYYFNMASALGHSLFRDRRIFTPKTGIAAPQGLERLDALRMNPYPIFLNNRNIEARSKKAIDVSGGLTSAQKTLAYLASQYNTQLNNARALADMQIQDNKYISDAVKTRLAAESAYDQRVVAQNNLRDDILMRGHAASQKMDIDDLTTASTAWQQANKNIFNRNIYRWMMDQYALENKANRKNRRWII